MDVHCCNCGEPWDQDFLRHELSDGLDGDLTAEGWRFGPSRLAVLHCPACPKAGYVLPDADERSVIVTELAELFGDDEDGLASTLEDFGL